MGETLVYRDRRGTGAIKWNGLRQIGFRREGLMGLWVADMDFAASEHVLGALRKAVDLGVFGYDRAPKEYFDAFIRWEADYHGYPVRREWIRYSPGVVAGLYWLVGMLTEPGDAILVQTPVYYPFMSAANDQGRRVVRSELVNTDGVYSVDFDDFEEKLREEKVKLFILCSPHNPVGRIWRREELERMLSLCRAYGVKVISDEIHQDFEFHGHRHIPAALAGDCDDMLVTLTAPGKTFNLAGLKNALVILPDQGLRDRFDAFTRSIQVTGADSLSYTACAAAYSHARPWLEEVLRTVEENEAILRERLARDLPRAVMSPLEGTYLAWVDLAEYVEAGEIKEIIEDRCGLAVDYGTQFGSPSSRHIRINLATSPENIRAAAEALVRGLTKR